MTEKRYTAVQGSGKHGGGHGWQGRPNSSPVEITYLGSIVAQTFAYTSSGAFSCIYGVLMFSIILFELDYYLETAGSESVIGDNKLRILVLEVTSSSFTTFSREDPYNYLDSSFSYKFPTGIFRFVK